uniref:Dihydroorotate dehydrogenase catalytic domain-containing protein n=1 Tax=Glossina austeni TaxID=7395 RepID=A0A1A9VXV4_GLOAU
MEHLHSYSRHTTTSMCGAIPIRAATIARYLKEQDIDDFRECFYSPARSSQITTLDELTLRGERKQVYFLYTLLCYSMESSMDMDEDSCHLQSHECMLIALKESVLEKSKVGQKHDRGMSEPQAGQPKTRAFRLVADEAITNRYGFNSEGHRVVYGRLKAVRESGQFSGILGVNLGKNKDSTSAKQNYVNEVQIFGPICGPNTPRLRDLQGKNDLEELLEAVIQARHQLSDASRSGRGRVRLASTVLCINIENRVIKNLVSIDNMGTILLSFMHHYTATKDRKNEMNIRIPSLGNRYFSVQTDLPKYEWP